MINDRRATSLTVLLFAVVATTVMVLYIKPITVDQFRDFIAHLAAADEMATTQRITLPHFLFHAVTVQLASLTGATLQTAAILLTAGAQGVTCLLLMCLFRFGASTLGLPRNLSPEMAMLAGFALSFVGPLSLPTLPNLYIGYAAISCAHSPTILLLRPFAVALFAAILLLLRSDSWGQWTRLATVATLLAVLGGLTKPSYNICIAPALGLLLGLRFWQAKALSRRAMATLGAIGLAISVVTLWQMTFTFAGGMEGGLTLAPLTVMSQWNHGNHIVTVAKLFMSLAFPLFVALAYWKAKSAGSDAFVLSWISMIVAIAISYLLSETGPRGRDGNLTWSLQICLLILMAMSVAVFVSEEGWFRRDQAPRVTWRALTGAVLFALHFFSGLIYILFAPLVI